MRDFRPIVRVLGRVVHHRGHHGAVSRRVTVEFVSDHAPRRTALPFQELPKEARRGSVIAAGLHQDIEHLTVLVDRPPQILAIALDGYEELVQRPGVAQWSASAAETLRVRPPKR